MTRTVRRLAAGLLLSAVVALGCTPSPTASADPGKLKSLEARVAKLEDDLKGATAARADLQARLSAAEAKVKAAEGRAAALERERDDARLALRAKSAERDAVQAQFEAFRKNLKDLLGKADVAGGATTSPASLLPAPNGL